jgi:outer membrane protein
MKKTLALTFALFASSLAPALAAPPAPPPGIPAPKILVIDRAAILRFSKVGQDVTKQIAAYSNQAKNDLDGQAKALQAQGQALQQQVAVLAPDVKAQKIKDFENKQRGLQDQATRKEQMIQYAMATAQQNIAQTLSPILAQLMTERGGNLILDKNAVVFANNSAFDITQAAIDRLNQKMASLKVTLTAPPAAPH